jgi:hypothetical protein
MAARFLLQDRYVRPIFTCAQHSENAVHDGVITVQLRPALSVIPARRFWNQRLQNRLLLIGQFFSSWHSRKLTDSIYEMSSR